MSGNRGKKNFERDLSYLDCFANFVNRKVPVGQCFSINSWKSKEHTSLPSSEIQKGKLSPADKVFKRCPNLRKEHTIGKLAVKLAQESDFGDDVLVQCTVMGCRSFPSLPLQELNELKQTVFSLYSHYWLNPVEFESKVWS